MGDPVHSVCQCIRWIVCIGTICRAAWNQIFPALVELINCDDLQVQRVVCVLLRAVTFGSSNTANKVTPTFSVKIYSNGNNL